MNKKRIGFLTPQSHRDNIANLGYHTEPKLQPARSGSPELSVESSGQSIALT